MFSMVFSMVGVLPNTASAIVVQECTPYEQTFVSSDSDAGAVATGFEHISWVSSSVVDGADWIWYEDPVSSPTLDDDFTFSKTINVTGTTFISAEIEIAADNGYEIKVNGSSVVNNLAIEDNYSSLSNHSLTFNPGNNTLEITVKNFAQDGGTTDSNPAGLLYKLVVESKTCEGPSNNTATVVATKIVCPTEDLLPNWGGGDSSLQEVTSNTADRFLNANPSCHLEEWDFQYKITGDQSNPGGTTIGELDSPWETFTNSVNIPVENVSLIQMREVLPTGYIPFTDDNNNNVSAEFYCGSDVAGYDNWEWINNPVALDTYYCVGFNVSTEEPETPSTTISATKIVCPTEDLLPNWGGGDSSLQEVTSNTADRFLNANPSCHLEEWDFAWSADGVGNPGDETTGTGGIDWNGFNDQTEIEVPAGERVWVREQFKDGYIPFTGENTTESVSAEFYCGSDILNYDNWEFIDTEEGEDYHCVAFNVPTETPPPQCVEEPNGSWADEVVSSEQGNRKDGSDVLAGRSNPEDVLGTSDWSSGGTDGFFSLGFGGSIVVSFDSFVPDVEGNDISIHEATNGTYPSETVSVEVSQDGVNWELVGAVDNTPTTTYLDFSSTGLAWIKFVKITDTSNPALHTNDADGFDLDAVDVTEQVCNEPEEEDGKGILIVKKVVVGGQAIPSDFSYIVDDGESTSFSDDSEGTEIVLSEGTHTVVESPVPEGWDLSVECVYEDYDTGSSIENGKTITVSEDNEVICTFTNTYNTSCSAEDATVELLNNGSFETPVVTDPAFWDIVASGTASWLANWINPTGAPATANLEFQKTGIIAGWAASSGDQWTELDSDWGGPSSSQTGEAGSVEISQTVSTVNGQVYKVSFDFSPRPGTTASENKVEVLVNDVLVPAATVGPTAGGANTAWTTQTFNFTATGASTKIAFRDAGTPNNSVGSLLDNTSMKCVAPDEQPETGTLIVKKTIVGGGEGDTADDFSFSVNAGVAVSFEADGQNDISQDVGSYSVTETTASGFTTTYSNDQNANADCDALNVTNGESVTCTITNTKDTSEPGTVTVTVVKYLDVEGDTDEVATVENTGDASFPMTSTWTAANLNGGAQASGDFSLTSGNSYSATTSEMTEGADYSVVENLPACDANDNENAFGLLGYKIGDSIANALASGFVTASFTNLQDDMFVVVINEDCGTPPPPTCPATYSDVPSGIRLESGEGYVLGTISGQDGWSATGPYDQAIVTNTYGYSSFENQSLRISDGVTSGSFGDWVFVKPLTNGAGETGATSGPFSTGTLQNHFEAQFDLASTIPCAEQPGLHISVSPDRGDGSRMSYLRFEDTPTGLDVFFDDVSGTTSPVSFNETLIANDLERSIPHKFKFVMDFVEGPSNDIVQIYIDGVLAHTGTSWENYFRYDIEAAAEQTPRVVKTLIIQARGTAHPANSGNGYLVDNLTLESSTPYDTSENNEISVTGGDSPEVRRSSSGSRRISFVAPGIVAGAETSCGIYVDKFLRRGYHGNNLDAVRAVQQFLRDYTNAAIVVDGVFGPRTEAALMAFQISHKDKILDPWGLTAPTGIFYLTTQTEVNNIMCPALDLPIPTNLIPFSANPATPNI